MKKQLVISLMMLFGLSSVSFANEDMGGTQNPAGTQDQPDHSHKKPAADGKHGKHGHGKHGHDKHGHH